MLRKKGASNTGAARVVARANGREDEDGTGGRVVGESLGEEGALDGECAGGRTVKLSRSAMDGGIWVRVPLLRLDALRWDARERI